jgi:hypothetical protein
LFGWNKEGRKARKKLCYETEVRLSAEVDKGRRDKRERLFLCFGLREAAMSLFIDIMLPLY